MRKSLLFLAASLMSTAAFAEDYDFIEGGIAYTKLTDKTVAVAEYTVAVGGEDVSQYKGSIVIPSSVTDGSVEYTVTAIAEEAFSHAEVTAVTLPETLERIGEQAFERTQLTTITLPKSVKYLGNESYWDEWDGNREWVEEDELYGDVFGGCRQLKEVKVDAANETYADIDGVLVTKDKKTLLYYPAGKTEAVIPTGIETLYDESFMGSKFTIVTLPASLKAIGAHAFEESALTSVTIPAGVTTIGEYAFGWCEDLKDVYVLATAPVEIHEVFPVREGWNEATNEPSRSIEATLHVPAGSKAAYETAEEWQLFTTIVEDAVDTGVASVLQNATVVERFTLGGMRTNQQHGVSIIRMSDGTTRKVYVK